MKRILFPGVVLLAITLALLTIKEDEGAAPPLHEVTRARREEDRARASEDLANLIRRIVTLRGLPGPSGEAGGGARMTLVLHDFVDPWGHEYLADLRRGVAMHCGEDGYRGTTDPDEVPDAWVTVPDVPAGAVEDAYLCPEPGVDRASWLREQDFTRQAEPLRPPGSDMQDFLAGEAEGGEPRESSREGEMEIETTFILIK